MLHRLTRRAFLMACAGAAAPGAGRAEPMADLPRGLRVLHGAVNTGVLTDGSRALLIDCCDSVTPARLARLGVRTVERVLCTNHRRTHAAGAQRWQALGARVAGPAAETSLFGDVDAHWSDDRNRWHVYHHQPGPQVLARPVPLDDALGDGDVVTWGPWRIRALATPGMTRGALSYVVEGHGGAACFCGAVLQGNGTLEDLAALQRGFGGLMDYHGLLGAKDDVVASLRRLARCGAGVLVPRRGPALRDPAAAAQLASSRLEALWRSYRATSSLNHYFPGLLETPADEAFGPARTVGLPPHIRRVAATSFAVIAENGGLLLIDCGSPEVVDVLKRWQADGVFRTVDLCWVTHYHDDHVDALPLVRKAFGCAIVADARVAEVISDPGRWLLPCVSPVQCRPDRVTRHGETWEWGGFRLTAHHLPGQTLYHGGLLVDGRGAKAYFVGDSGSPTGLDDYTAANRVFHGRGRGTRRCLDIWRACRPDLLINCHQEQGFVFGPRELDALDAAVRRRERLLADLVDWPHADFGLDEGWVRCVPYQVSARPGEAIEIGLELTNHGGRPVRARAEAVPPPGWTQQGGSGVVPARSCGWYEAGSSRSDARLSIRVDLPPDARAGRVVVPVQVWWGERYLGQVRHALVDVTAERGAPRAGRRQRSAGLGVARGRDVHASRAAPRTDPLLHLGRTA